MQSTGRKFIALPTEPAVVIPLSVTHGHCDVWGSLDHPGQAGNVC